MRRLVLVKHSLPTIDPSVPAREWRLSAEGRARCAPLGERLAAYQPTAMVASAEPKASETAELVAARLRLPMEVVPGLGEHDRHGVPYLGDADWSAAMARFFARPEELVLGRETADQAGERFVRAVDGVLARHPRGTVAVVAHGTVIALFLAARAGAEPFPLWQRLGLPSFAVLSLPGLALVEVVGSVQ